MGIKVQYPTPHRHTGTSPRENGALGKIGWNGKCGQGNTRKSLIQAPPPKKTHTTTQFKKMMGWVGEKRGFENPEKAILGTMWHKYAPPPSPPKKKNTYLLKNGALGKIWKKGKPREMGKPYRCLLTYEWTCREGEHGDWHSRHAKAQYHCNPNTVIHQ